jgi:hypothetical protein
MNTPMSDFLDLGSPVPDLVESFTARESYFLNSLGDRSTQNGGTSKRWGSKSSASSGNSVKSAALAAARRRETQEDMMHTLHTFRGKSISRPQMLPGNRLSTMSFASTVPSTHLQTPGLMQDGFAFQPSGLAVSVEDDGEHYPEENNDGPGDGGEGPGANQKGMKSADKHGKGGTMIAERRRQFEGTSVVKNDTREHTEPPFAPIRPRTGPTAFQPWKKAVGTTTKNTLSGATALNSTTIVTCVSADSVELGRSASSSNDTKTIGLGLENLLTASGSSESDADWRTAADAIVESIDRASGPSRRSGSSGKC